jgi:hypothetical protein
MLAGLFQAERKVGMSDLKKYIAKRKKTDKEFFDFPLSLKTQR